MKYKIGDKVRIRSDLVAGKEYGGRRCTKSMADLGGKIFEVITARELLEGYYLSCGLLCVFTDTMLEPVSEEAVPKPTWRIIIEGDGNTSRAKYVVGKSVVKEASAKRYHKDKHDPAMAARALIGKMFPEAEKKEEPPKYFTGKVVCVEANTCMFEKGRIYYFSLNGGRGYNDRTGNTILSTPAKSVEEINQRLASKFIEIKE